MSTLAAEAVTGYYDGIDISNHQPNWQPGSEKYVYILASDGHTWKSPTVADQAKKARAAGKRVGFYHWLRPGNITGQVAWLLKVLQGILKDGDVLACDWEQSGTSNQDKDQFIKALRKAAPKNRVVLYCNKNYWLNYDKTSFTGDGLWIAAYDVNDPGITYPWQFWQYADHPATDHNHGRFTGQKEYDAWANFTVTPAPPVTGTIPIDPTLDAIHTKYGQWGPSWSWNKGKNPDHPTWGQHGGDDWHRNAGKAEIGDPIVAVADGKVIYAGDARKTDAGWGKAFGIHVLITWTTGDRTSIDAHMNKLAKGIKAGSKVKAGDTIGYKGQTGNVSGPHDHHEQHLGDKWTDKRVKPIYPGKKVSGPVDPIPQPTPPTPTPPREEFDVAEQAPTKHRTKDQIIKAGTGRHVLYLDDKNNVSWAFGGGRYQCTSQIRFTGATASDELLVSVQIADTDKDGKVLHSSYTPVTGLPGGDGTSFRQFDFRRNIGAPPKGQTRRLRLSVQNSSGKDITVTEVYTYVWKAPLK